MALIDITSRQFGRLTVQRYAGVLRGKPSWLCLCSCGTAATVRGDMLKSGNTKSCGCQKVESLTKHGHSHSRPGKPPSRTYVTWQSMVARCRNVDNPTYGGAGIRVCERWHSFENFLADMGERPAGMTIERLLATGDYEPDNCRWASALEQSRNRKSSRHLSLNGEALTVSEWAERLRIPRPVLQDRIRLGWDAERILTTPYTKRS